MSEKNQTMNSCAEMYNLEKVSPDFNVRNNKTAKALPEGKQSFFRMFCEADSEKDYIFIKDMMKLSNL